MTCKQWYFWINWKLVRGINKLVLNVCFHLLMNYFNLMQIARPVMLLCAVYTCVQVLISWSLVQINRVINFEDVLKRHAFCHQSVSWGARWKTCWIWKGYLLFKLFEPFFVWKIYKCSQSCLRRDVHEHVCIFFFEDLYQYMLWCIHKCFIREIWTVARKYVKSWT